MTDDDMHTYGRRSVLKALGGAAAFAGLAGEGAAATDARRLIVGIADGSSIDDVGAAVAADASIPGEATVVHHNEAIDYAIVEVPADASPEAASTTANALTQQSSVRYVEGDYAPEPAVEEIQAVTPNDPRWGNEWADEAMNVPQAWETTLGSMDSTVAIVDTGLDVTHPDLEDRVTSEVGGPDPVPSGPDDHGTHCGGCAAASTNNGVGVAGPTNSRLLGYSYGNIRGEDAIIDATDLGADVISLSWSIGYSPQQSLHDAVQYATNNGTVVLAASANDGRTDAVTYPAAFPEVIAVGATDQNGNVAGFSNSGPGLDLVAPGVNVLSTLPQSSYGDASGTSMACPCAAGVAALAKELDPSLSPEDVRTVLTDTATTLSGVPANRQAAGQVDAAAVVAEVGGDGGTDLVSGGTYKITNVNSGKALEVAGGGTANGDNVQQWAYADHAHQRWTINEIEDGVYQLLVAHTGKSLDVHDALQDPGANVKQWDYVGGANQKFRIEDAGDGTYQIVADHSGHALDVDDWSTDNGANVLQWNAHGGANQRWEFEHLY